MGHMYSTDAIAAFFRKGGRVVKLQEPIPVTPSEVLEYLLATGIKANFSRRHSRLYLCKGKLVTLSKLVEVANGHRRAQQLPPFVARVSLALRHEPHRRPAQPLDYALG